MDIFPNSDILQRPKLRRDAVTSLTSMAPSKQKSLMGWLTKPPAEKDSGRSQPPSKPVAIASTKSGASKFDPTTPERKSSNILEDRGSSGVRSEMSGSSLGLGEMQTPPTSDFIDVDMLADVEEERVAPKLVNPCPTLYNRVLK